MRATELAHQLHVLRRRLRDAEAAAAEARESVDFSARDWQRAAESAAAGRTAAEQVRSSVALGCAPGCRAHD